MKKTLKELKEKDIKTLTKDLSFLNEKLTKLRFDLAFRKLKNVNEIRATRKQIARIWTILGQKALAKIESEEVTQ